MQLYLNKKEWMDLLLYLEREASRGFESKEITPIRNRLREVAEDALAEKDLNRFEAWSSRVMHQLKEPQPVLTDEEEGQELRRSYPRRPPRVPRPGRKGRYRGR